VSPYLRSAALSIGSQLINAQAETAAIKPAFRVAFRKRRCLILADGFYEWKKEGRHRQPFHIRLRDGRPFAFAGLWERWEGPEGGSIDSCTILTTTSNPLVAEIHDRIPVILAPQDYDLWLDPAVQEPDRLQPLLRPYPAEEMTAYPVSPRVNNPQHDDPLCTEPVTDS
jgi:putative SOS response-associated peptidase YedK